jgi:predicted nucleic acid-binding protein
LAVFSIIDVTGDDCRKALELDIADFEDALLMVCAYNIKADYIVSRDAEFLKLKSMVEVISAQDFLGGRE